jgi:hypothetical protein
MCGPLDCTTALSSVIKSTWSAYWRSSTAVSPAVYLSCVSECQVIRVEHPSEQVVIDSPSFSFSSSASCTIEHARTSPPTTTTTTITTTTYTDVCASTLPPRVNIEVDVPSGAPLWVDQRRSVHTPAIMADQDIGDSENSPHRRQYTWTLSVLQTAPREECLLCRESIPDDTRMEA